MTPLVGLMGHLCSLGLATCSVPNSDHRRCNVTYVFIPIFEDAKIYTLLQDLEIRHDSRVSIVSPRV